MHSQLSINALKPGIHWDEIQHLCHQTLIRGFQKLGIFFTPTSPNSGSWNSEEAILASGVSAAFFPHGVGHSLGLDVHDVPSASRPKGSGLNGGKGVSGGCEAYYTYSTSRSLCAKLTTNLRTLTASSFAYGLYSIMVGP